MSDSHKLIRIFVAAPSDVGDERGCLRRVVDDLNQPGALAEQHGCTLQVLDRQDVVSGMGRPEEVILEQLPLESWDVFVGILWKHFGVYSGGRDTETGQFYGSGAEEEFTLAYRAWKQANRPHILFYRRSTSPPSLDEIDPDQLSKVNRFWQQFETDCAHPGVVCRYETPSDFERRVRSDLSRLLGRLRRDYGPLSSAEPLAAPKEGLSPGEEMEEFTPTSIEWTAYDKAGVREFFSYYHLHDMDIANDSQLLERFRDWRLVCRVEGRWVFTRIGVLLFGPVDRLAAYVYTDVQIDDKRKGTQRTLYGHSLMRLLPELMEALTPLWSEAGEDPSERDAKGRPAKFVEYPEVAIVEALVNFLIHRNYHANDLAWISIHEDKLEMVNPGSSQYEKEELLSGSELRPKYDRNPHLIAIVSRTSLNQRQGAGLARIIESMVKNGNVFSDGKPAIEIINDKQRDRFRLVVHKKLPSRTSYFGAAVSPLHQLPADLVDFTGREKEVGQLAALLGEGAAGATISAIGGMGGVGKTALAVHVAHQVLERYPDGQIVVEMGGTSERPLTPVEAMGQVLHAFQPELRLPDDPKEVVALYRTILEGRRVLLLLDNAANSAQVRPLVVPAGCGLVVTSRRNISLPGARHFDLDVLPVEEARDVLRAIVGQGRATEEELGAIAGLCGRLPLALRMAGDFLVVHRDWSAAEYAQALADERERLGRLKHEDLDVGAALGLSAAQLVRERPDLAARWQMLAVFPAPFERSAVAAVWDVEEGEAREGLSELAARSLVLYEREGGLYRLHDLMRLVAEDAFGYGGGERDAEGERTRLAEAAMRHAAYYLEVGRRANNVYLQGGEHVLEGLRLFDGAWPHLWAAYGRMRGRGDKEAAQWTSDFPGRMVYVLDLRLPPREQIPILEAAAAAAREIGERRLEGNHLGNLGLAYAALGEVRRAIEYHEQALEIDREIGDRRGEGNGLMALGLAYADLGEVRRAIEYYEQALVIAREIGDRRGEGQDLGNLGAAYHSLGEVQRAIECYEQALAIQRAIGDRRGEGNALGNLGIAYKDLGEVRRAIEYHEQALVIAREIGDRRGEGNALGNLGLAYADLGEVRRAIEYYEQALAIRREIGDRRGEGQDLGNLGVAYKNLGEVRRAIEYYGQALAIAREIGDRRGEGNRLGNLGSAYYRLGEVQRAIEYYEQALAIDREIGDRRGEAFHCWNLGLLYEDSDPARAAELMQVYVEYEREIGHPDAEADAERVRGLLDQLGKGK